MTVAVSGWVEYLSGSWSIETHPGRDSRASLPWASPAAALLQSPCDAAGAGAPPRQWCTAPASQARCTAQRASVRPHASLWTAVILDFQSLGMALHAAAEQDTQWTRINHGQEQSPAIGSGRAKAVLGRQSVATRHHRCQRRLLLQDVEDGCAGGALIGISAQAVPDEDSNVFRALLRHPACMACCFGPSGGCKALQIRLDGRASDQDRHEFISLMLCMQDSCCVRSPPCTACTVRRSSGFQQSQALPRRVFCMAGTPRTMQSNERSAGRQ